MLSLLEFASTSTIDTLSASVQGPVALDRCYVWGILIQRAFLIFTFCFRVRFSNSLIASD